MITPILERLLLTGKATKINKSHGYGAAGIIKCPADRWIVITSILYYPFFDIFSNTPTDLTAGNMMNLRLFSKLNEQNYTFKNSVHLPNAGSDNVDSPPVVYDVFDVHKSDVIIQITKCIDISTAADVSYTKSLPQAQLQFPPAGLGISNKTVRRVNYGVGFTDIMPEGIEASSDLASTARTREDMVFDASSGVLLQPTNNQQVPLINFTCVIINSKDIQNN